MIQRGEKVMRGRNLATRAGRRQNWELAVVPLAGIHVTEIESKERTANGDQETNKHIKPHLKQTHSRSIIPLSMLSACFIHFFKILHKLKETARSTIPWDEAGQVFFNRFALNLLPKCHSGLLLLLP